MANLTITVDDKLLKQARLRALQEGSSVNALLRRYLESYAGVGGSAQAVQNLLEKSRQSHSGSGPRGRTWRRDDLHDR